MKLKALKSYSLITLGTFLMAVGVYFFEFTNNFTTGGASGIALVLSKALNLLTPSQMATVINVVILIIGYIIIGKTFAFKTLYSTLLLSALLNIFEKLCPMDAPITNYKVLELFIDMLLVSVGAALIFNEEASSGGTDILAMILQKYTNLNIGKALLIVDFLVICCAFATFGIEVAMFSLFAIVIRALVVDNAIEGFSSSKFFIIITDKKDEIVDFILNDLERGASIINHCEGAFTKENKHMIISVVDKTQAVKLKHKIKEIDKYSFVIVGTSNEIFGDGFRIS